MDFNLVTARLWLDFSQTANFEVQYLLEGDAYQRAALIRGWSLL